METEDLVVVAKHTELVKKSLKSKCLEELCQPSGICLKVRRCLRVLQKHSTTVVLNFGKYLEKL
uniref:Uncharacterized protein n=1 Tax=Megaselia scalaris TaxID=36166 RepID=T1GB25_MEGSC